MSRRFSRPPSELERRRGLSSRATTTILLARSSASTVVATRASTADAAAAGEAGCRWSSGVRRRSATLLALFACHAQGRTRERLQSRLADRVAADLADRRRCRRPSGARARSTCRSMSRELLASDISCSRSKVLLPGVGLVVPRAVAAVAQQSRELTLRLGDLHLVAQPTSASSSARTSASSAVVHGTLAPVARSSVGAGGWRLRGRRRLGGGLVAAAFARGASGARGRRRAGAAAALRRRTWPAWPAARLSPTCGSRSRPRGSWRGAPAGGRRGRAQRHLLAAAWLRGGAVLGPALGLARSGGRLRRADCPRAAMDDGGCGPVAGGVPGQLFVTFCRHDDGLLVSTRPGPWRTLRRGTDSGGAGSSASRHAG